MRNLQQDPTRAPRYCPYCGSPTYGYFCQNCGAQLEGLFHAQHGGSAGKTSSKNTRPRSKSGLVASVVLCALALVIIVSMGTGNQKESAAVIRREPPVVTSNELIQKTEEPAALNNPDETILEALLVNEAGIKITAKGLDKNGFWGPELKLLIENNSGKDLTFQCRNASVNGYMVDTTMSVDVLNEKKANDTLTFSRSDLNICGIDTIADMEFNFHIFGADDWETYLDTQTIRLITSAAEEYNYTYDESGWLAYDNNGVKIVVKGISENVSMFGPSIVVHIHNLRSQNITVQARNVSVNGFMVDPTFSCDLCSWKCAIDTITFMRSELEENNITNINTVELSFHVFDADSWDTIFDTEAITITL